MSTIVRTLLAHDLIRMGKQLEGECKSDWDAYKGILADVEAEAPEMRDIYENDPRSLLMILDEQVVALACAAWLAGAEYGERLMKGEVVPSGDD